MHIVCPHCTTSYAINPATLGDAGRSVRCARCKEVWLARPEDAVEVPAQIPAMAEAQNEDAAAEWEAMARDDAGEEQDTPVVDSPSISGDWPDEDASKADWSSMEGDDAPGGGRGRFSRLSGLNSTRAGPCCT